MLRMVSGCGQCCRLITALVLCCQRLAISAGQQPAWKRLPHTLACPQSQPCCSLLGAKLSSVSCLRPCISRECSVATCGKSLQATLSFPVSRAPGWQVNRTPGLQLAVPVSADLLSHAHGTRLLLLCFATGDPFLGGSLWNSCYCLILQGHLTGRLKNCEFVVYLLLIVRVTMTFLIVNLIQTCI